MGAVLLCLVVCLCVVMRVEACTAVYVGNRVSDDGTTIIAKSNDYQAVWANYVTITERVENRPGRTMPVDNDATVFAELPATTWRYTATPWMDSANALNGLGKDATACANERGVAMIMSITSFSNAAALEADPLIEHGITEFTAVDLVTCQSASAREGVEVLCSLIDRYGSSEINIALISDQTETWYVEMYNGHQYAAVKLPDDMVCAFGNEFSLEYLSDYDDHIVSADLERLAAENGFAVYGRGGELNLLATYSGDEVVTNYSHMRTWIAHRILSPSAYGDYDKSALYPLCFAPDAKVSLQDVMEIMRNRFEGTEYSPDETGRTDMRVIGTDTALSVHIAQVYPDLPAELSCVTWESTGPALYGVFVPVSNGALSISAPYGRNQSADQAGVFDTEHYPYYRFKELTTLGVEHNAYRVYGQPVRAYWHEAESGMIRGMREVLRSAAAIGDSMKARRYITDYCNAIQEQAFSDAGQLLNDVRWYLSTNSNTMKNGRNPETHEVIDELKPIAPLTVRLDGAAYRMIPEPAGPDQAELDPNAPCSRAQMLLMLWRAAGQPEPRRRTMPFVDIAQGGEYETAVLWAVETGITAGVDAAHFAPEQTVTRAQDVTFLFRCRKGSAQPMERFADVAADAWYAEAVSWAAANGITNGTGSGMFSPDAPCTCGQAAAFLDRAGRI